MGRTIDRRRFLEFGAATAGAAIGCSGLEHYRTQMKAMLDSMG